MQASCRCCDAVRTAEEARMKNAPPRGYQPIEGSPAYNKAVQDLLFGAGAALTGDGRVVTAQALGGTGALKIGADFLKRLLPQAKVYISDPSWENHRALFEAAGFEVDVYPYFDADTRGVRFDAMIGHLNSASGQRDRAAARLLPQPDRRRHDRRTMGRSGRSVQGAQPRALPRHGLPGLCRRHREGCHCGSTCSCSRA
jgi:hypothetical protein